MAQVGIPSQNKNEFGEASFVLTDSSGAGLAIGGACRYHQIGTLVSIYFRIIYPATADINFNMLNGLPFNVAYKNLMTPRTLHGIADLTAPVAGIEYLKLVARNIPGALPCYEFSLYDPNTQLPVTNAFLSGLTIIGSGTYFTGP